MIKFFSNLFFTKVKTPLPVKSPNYNICREFVLIPSSFELFEKDNKTFLSELTHLYDKNRKSSYRVQHFNDRVFIYINAVGNASGKSVLKYVNKLSKDDFFNKRLLNV